MDALLNDETAQAVAEIVRDALIEGHAIDVPGLGTFSVTHESSQVRERVDGTEEMLPPRDVVAFAADTAQ